MSETVKLIVTLSKGQYENLNDIQFGSIGSKMIFNAVQNGIPLDDVKAEIFKAYDDVTMYSCDEQVSCFASRVSEVLDNIGKGDGE